MDILETLEKSGTELYVEDLDFFETELDTGEYDGEYIARCKSEIAKLRQWMKAQGNPIYSEDDVEPQKNGGVMKGLYDIVSQGNSQLVSSVKPEDVIFSDISAIRENSTYKSDFKKYVKEKTAIDSAFIEKFYSFFKPWELDAIVSVKPLDEEFLEKYFGALDHCKIARYQRFSEAFFIKHFSQLDAKTVLLHGPNEWRKRENRSKQLDVFLRLKGVKV